MVYTENITKPNINKMSVVCVTVQMENPDKGEEWRCYILTVVRVSKHELIHTLIQTNTQ